MRQFDVYLNPNSQLAARFPLILVLQHHDLDNMHTVVVAPLRKWTTSLMPKQKLNLRFEIEAENYMLLPELMAAIDKRTLKKYVYNLLDHQLEIKRAVDVLLGGV